MMSEGRLIETILVPTDGSEYSMRAAAYAAEIAHALSATVTVLNVAEVTGMTQFVSYSVESTGNLERDLRTTGLNIVEKTRKPLDAAGVRTHVKVIEGYAAEMIIQEATDGEYDMIIMASSGIGTGLVQKVIFGLGSVAERVVANAPCPVMVVRE